MEIPITLFRRKIFELVNQAMSGAEVWVAYKGRRFRVVPDAEPTSRLSRITPLEIISPAAGGRTEQSLQQEMTALWERDWSTL